MLNKEVSTSQEDKTTRKVTFNESENKEIIILTRANEVKLDLEEYDAKIDTLLKYNSFKQLYLCCKDLKGQYSKNLHRIVDDFFSDKIWGAKIEDKVPDIADILDPQENFRNFHNFIGLCSLLDLVGLAYLSNYLLMPQIEKMSNKLIEEKIPNRDNLNKLLAITGGKEYGESIAKGFHYKLKGYISNLDEHSESHDTPKENQPVAQVTGFILDNEINIKDPEDSQTDQPLTMVAKYVKDSGKAGPITNDRGGKGVKT